MKKDLKKEFFQPNQYQYMRFYINICIQGYNAPFFI